MCVITENNMDSENEGRGDNLSESCWYRGLLCYWLPLKSDTSSFLLPSIRSKCPAFTSKSQGEVSGLESLSFGCVCMYVCICVCVYVCAVNILQIQRAGR